VRAKKTVRAKKKKKSPVKKRKKPSVKTSALVPQKHGGALLPGAGGGPQPGAGRPPSKIREAARLAFAERLDVLTGITDGKEERSADRIAAMKVLADTGGVDKIALTVEEQPEQEMTPERIAGLFEQIQRIKTVRQLERLLVGVAKKQGES
jgi:hypothetical protein